jgi:hypothetical protein
MSGMQTSVPSGRRRTQVHALSLAVVLGAVLVGCVNDSPYNNSGTTTTLPGTPTDPVLPATQAELDPAAVRPTDPASTTAGGTVEMMFPDQESRSMAWSVHPWPQSGPPAEPDYQLIAQNTLGCVGCPTWDPWPQRRGVELTSIEGSGPDTVIIPGELDSGRYAICEAFTGTPCFQVEVVDG